MARNDEAKIQAAIVGWARSVAPEAIIFAVPNGGLRSKREAPANLTGGQCYGSYRHGCALHRCTPKGGCNAMQRYFSPFARVAMRCNAALVLRIKGNKQ